MGTPISHNKMPFPITSSLSYHFQNVSHDPMFLRAVSITLPYRQSPMRPSAAGDWPVG